MECIIGEKWNDNLPSWSQRNLWMNLNPRIWILKKFLKVREATSFKQAGSMKDFVYLWKNLRMNYFSFFFWGIGPIKKGNHLIFMPPNFFSRFFFHQFYWGSFLFSDFWSFLELKFLKTKVFRWKIWRPNQI